MLYETENKRRAGGGGNYVKTGVCNEHTEAAGTLKVEINNPI